MMSALPMHLCETCSMTLPKLTSKVLPYLDDVHINIQLGLGHEFHDDGLLQCVPNDGGEFSCTAIRFALLAPLTCEYSQTSPPSQSGTEKQEGLLIMLTAQGIDDVLEHCCRE